MNTILVRGLSSSSRWLLVLLVLLLAVSGCGSPDPQEDGTKKTTVAKEGKKPEGEKEKETDEPEGEKEGDKAEGEEEKETVSSPEAVNQPPKALKASDLGAANYVGEDVSLFISLRDVLPRWKRVWQSNAVQSLLELPAIKQGVAQMLESPEYDRYRQMLFEHPMAAEGLPIMQDAMSHEMFVCAGPELPGVLEAVGGMINAMQLMSYQQALMGREPSPPDLNVFVDLILESRSHLKAPSVLVGCQLEQPEAAVTFLTKWFPEKGVIPYATVEKRTVGGTAFHVVEWTGKSLPQDEMNQMIDDLRSEGVSPDKCRQLAEMLGDLRLTVAAGVLDDYLLISVGDGTPMLSSWGQGSLLAHSDELAPLRENLKPGLISTIYTSQQLQGTFLPKREEFQLLFEGIVPMIPEQLMADGGEMKPFRARAQKDVLELLGEINFPDPHSSLSFSFENRGIETFTYGPPSGQTSLDHSQPLSILAHRGEQPIGYSAARASQNAEAYEFISKWGARAFGYFEDFAAPQIAPGDREQYEQVMAVVRPFVASLDETTREYLIPSAGDQSLVVIDGRGVVEETQPEDVRAPLPWEIPIPRVGAALELKDSKKFAEAIRRYYQAAETLLARVREKEIAELPPEVKLFPPQTSNVAGGTLYFYRIPFDIGDDALACALLLDNLLILSTSSNLAEEMAESRPMPSCEMVSIDEAAGAVTVVEFAALLRYFKTFYEMIATMSNQFEDGPVPAAVIEMHVDGVLRSLGAFRSYSCTTRVENGRVVQHSWLRVEDIPE